jgi:signal transduction histidine kinase
MRASLRAFPLRISLLYFAVSAIWIAGSDAAVTILTNKPYLIEQTVKGLGFVTATTLLLYWLMKREKKAQDRANAAQRRAYRAYRLLSACNQVLVRAQDEDSLLQNLCQTIVTLGGYQLAWAGFTEQTPERPVRPIAWAGHEAEHLTAIQLSWTEDMEAAIRTRCPQVARLSRENLPYTGQDEAPVPEHQAVAVLPFSPQKDETGILTIYAAEPDAFDDDEVALLNELAHDLAYGLRALRTRRDLTEATRALAEVARHQSELERARLLLPTAIHDLRNPLAVIKTSIDLLRRYGNRMSEAEREKRFENIVSNVHFMTELFDDLLAMGKTDTQRAGAHFQPLDLPAFCRARVAEMTEISNRQVHFEAVGECTPVATDPDLLRHILTNLLENAVRYSPADGTVTLTLTCQPDHVILRVQDQGIGIPAQDLPHLFEPFFRASNTADVRGTGLGLTIVRQAVEALGGTIAVESAEGQGTTFTVTLPVLAAEK